MGLSPAHWVFFAVTIAVLIALAVRRGVIILAMGGVVMLALLSPHSGHDLIDKVIFCAQAMFRTAIVGGSRLFDTILLVGFLGALLHLLREEGICDVMMAPFERLMRGPRSAFLVLAGVGCLASLFFWPTPAVLMIGALLVPAALQMGISPAGAGMAISIATFGMALSADPVVQAAPRITGAPAAIAPNSLLPIATILALTAGIVALTVAFFRRPPLSAPTAIMARPEKPVATSRQKLLAVIIPLALGATVLLSLNRPATTADDGTAVALLGGMAVVLLILTCFVQHGTHALDHIVDMMTEGFFIVIRIFAPVVPVLGFFMIGDPAGASEILGEGTPGYLSGIAVHFGCNGLIWALVLPMLMVIVGTIAGRDGVAFTGLPLVGAIAAMLSGGDPQQAAILASLGQFVTIWIGAGVYLPWSGVRTVAAQVGLTREQLSQANHVPVIAGLISAMSIAAIMLYRNCAPL